jgi:hypothetical protein
VLTFGEQFYAWKKFVVRGADLCGNFNLG